MEPQFKTIAIYGVGLLGASIGLAVKELGIAETIIGIGRNEDKLKHAIELGCIDEYYTDSESGLHQSDFIILCTPIQHIIEELPHVAKVIPEKAIVTDVGSTKSGIMEAAEKTFPEKKFFVGSHPIAGGEKTGAEYGKADLFKGACCVVTYSDLTNQEAFDSVCEFWEKLGSRIISTNAAEHDRLLAAVSHLPHMTAVALVDTLKNSDINPEIISAICGNGLRDTTRIAAGSPEIWKDICSDNRAEIYKSINALINSLHKIRIQLEEDELTHLNETLKEASDFRKLI